MVELVERMQRIEYGTARVSEIVSLIDGITFQTNLLALNAAVEAARAGAFGRGFAVVASEVRHPSERTAQTAKDVKALVSSSKDSVAAGALLAGQVGEVVARVVRSTQGVAANIRQVTIHTECQGVEIADVSVALARISEATQQNAALVEQSSAASHRLLAQAEALSGQIRGFVLADSMSAVPRAEIRTGLRPLG